MEIEVYKTKKDVARALSTRLETWCRDEGFRSIALSGGSTPEIWFDLLALEYQQKLPWSELRFYWGDERCVPPDDPQSNYRMTRDHLLKKVPVEPSYIYRIRGEDPPLEEAIRYSELLEESLPQARKLPQFDLVILGMGDDGHTASIFPHQIDLWASKSHCEVARHPDSGQKRISLTGHIINNAKQVVFLVTGANKAATLAQIHHARPGSEKLPASLVAPESGCLLWMVDEAAATDL